MNTYTDFFENFPWYPGDTHWVSWGKKNENGYFEKWNVISRHYIQNVYGISFFKTPILHRGKFWACNVPSHYTIKIDVSLYGFPSPTCRLKLPCLTLITSHNMSSNMLCTPWACNKYKMSITWIKNMSSMTKWKNHEAKGKWAEKLAAILLVLATFKTLGQFNIFQFSQRVLSFKLMAIKCLSFKCKGQQSNESLNLKCSF